MKFYLIDFQADLIIDGCCVSYDVTLRWLSLNLTDTLTLVQVIGALR